MNRRTLIQLAGMTGAAAMVPTLLALNANADEITPSTVYELRVYHLNEGKLPLIMDRFRTKERELFARAGMHEVAFFMPTDDPGNAEPGGRTWIYIMRHASREAARQSWEKFAKDPEWIALKTETEKDGPFVAKIESTFLQLADFSPRI